MAESDQQQRVPGLAVDAGGGPVIDPSENVKALVISEAKRIDQLREADDKRIAAELTHVREMATLRELGAKDTDALKGELRASADRRNEAELRHLAAMAELRSDCAHEISDLKTVHDREMREAEKERLNSIRLVDVGAAATATATALTGIQTLATATTTMAETLRTSAEKDKQRQEERIVALERQGYTAGGRSMMSDPAIAELVAEMKGVRQSLATGTGKSEGLGMGGQIIVGVFAIIAVLVAVMSFMSRETAVVPPPQVVYQVAPPVAAPPVQPVKP
jgi:hypothetical protein